MAGKAGRRVGMLTARGVEVASKPGLYGDGNGLYLKVDDGGSKSWISRWSSGGKKQKHGIGPLHTVPLALARDKNAEVRRMILDGIDPRVAKREQEQAAAVAKAKTISFDDARDQYIESHRAGWKNAKHAAQWKATLATYASPVFGKLPVSAIDTGLVMRVLEPIWSKKTETANRVRGRIEAVLTWAEVFGYRGSGKNPAQWRGHLDHLLPARGKVSKVEHHAALAYDQMSDFMRDLRERFGVAALALEFTILTAARTSETLEAVWSEFDLDKAIWTIPAKRMKGDREQRVPLCDRAVAIVEEMRTIRHGDFVFPGAKRGKPLSNMSMLNVLRRMERGDLTVHGFRATFKTWATERSNYQREVIECALAHRFADDETEAAYMRGDLLDKRRRLMDAWSSFCDSRVTTGDVVSIR